MIKVCESCSRVHIETLKTVVSEDLIKVGCVGHCEGHDGKVFGIIDGNLVIEDSEASFIEKVKEAVK